MNDDGLYVLLTQGDLALVPLAPEHREGLRAACAADDAIWDIYPNNFRGEAFDTHFDRLLTSAPARRIYAIMQGSAVAGMTGWLDQGQPGWAIEIGNSYIAPALRGTGFNTRVKHLMLNHAFGLGLERVVFKVDVRNTRSQAAVVKLGATREGVLRHERKTWTGHVRDTVVFSILRPEWLPQ